MSKNKKRNTKTSVAELIKLFKTNPCQAYKSLISSSHYFDTKQSDDFWTEYNKLDHKSLAEKFTESISTFKRVSQLKIFYDLKKSYETKKSKTIENILSLNPDETSFSKALFLCLELGSTLPPQPNDFPNYTEESFKAVKKVLREILPKLKKENQTSYSPELVRCSNNLLKIQIDIDLLTTFLDAFVSADFEMTPNKDSKKLILSLPDNKPKNENIFILNQLKTIIKRDFKRQESQPKISEEKHFKKIDSKWKTNEGPVIAFHSKNLIPMNQTQKGISLQIEDDSIFSRIISANQENQDKATFQIISLKQEQNFHSQFRQALSQVYQPNEEIDIHTLQLEIKDSVFISLFELICAQSCLIAKAYEHQSLVNLTNNSIEVIKYTILQQHGITLHEDANNFIIQHLVDFENLFFFTKQEVVSNWLRSIEELKEKSESELNAMIDFLSSLDSPLPFNAIYKIDSKYYFSYRACDYRFNLNRLLYDNYVSDKLFNPNRKPKEERITIDKTQKDREISFTNSLKELFKKFTPFAEANLDYSKPSHKYDFGNLKGEFDVIAYFDKENIIIPIQVKLSNTSPRSEKRKKEWILNHIEKKGIEQVGKDFELLQTKSGLEFIADNLKVNSEIKNPLIYPLIVTDNFFADHLSFYYEENNNPVFCVSYFELKHLILNQKIHNEQKDWSPFNADNAASQLIEIIKNNTFWDFINDFALDFKLEKSLSLINEDFNIEMII